mgnify:CR=1 FL=1|jgi:hypothetical protein
MKYPSTIYAATDMVCHMDITSVLHNMPLQRNNLNR